jgi:hypothetical protein
MNKNVLEVLADTGPKCRVRNAVKPLLPEIAEYLGNGGSKGAIHRKLKADGHNVGSKSGFTNVLRYFETELQALIAEGATAKAAKHYTALSAPSGPDFSCIDDRNSNQVGRS